VCGVSKRHIISCTIFCYPLKGVLKMECLLEYINNINKFPLCIYLEGVFLGERLEWEISLHLRFLKAPLGVYDEKSITIILCFLAWFIMIPLDSPTINKTFHQHLVDLALLLRAQ